MSKFAPRSAHVANQQKLESKQQKLSVLEVVGRLKELLFAPLSSKVTQQVKMQAWNEVLERAKMVNLASDEEDWTYARDKLFNTWKSRTMVYIFRLTFLAVSEIINLFYLKYYIIPILLQLGYTNYTSLKLYKIKRFSKFPQQ